jgi:hypothetical protein
MVLLLTLTAAPSPSGAPGLLGGFFFEPAKGSSKYALV